jgi:hypothetical protein
MLQKAVRGRPFHDEPQFHSQQSSGQAALSGANGGIMAMTIRIGTNGAGGFALRVAALLALAPILLPTPALAQHNPCEPGYNDPIPSCELQPQIPVPFSSWQTSGWAFYCTGDHPYFYGMQEGYYDAFSWDNKCFSVIENEFDDGVNKLDVTMTNWCFKKEDITLTLACSSTPPPGIAPCTLTGGAVKDPGCPQSDVTNYCSSSNPPVCVQTYVETCSNNVTYFCTLDVAFSYCLQCVPNSLSRPAKRASLSASSLLKRFTAPAPRPPVAATPVQPGEARRD